MISGMKRGWLLFSGKRNEQLIAQSKEIYDGATPSGNSVALMNILRLSRMTGNLDLTNISGQLMRTFAETVNNYPSGYTHFLCALDFALGPTKEIVIAGEPGSDNTSQILKEIRRRFLPGKVVILHPEKDKSIEEIIGFVKEQKAIDGKATAYICENYACKAPTNDMKQIMKLLDGR